MLSEGPQADLGLWAITTLGIKYLMATDTTQKKKLNVGQKRPFFYFLVPRSPQELPFMRSGGTGPPVPPVSTALVLGILTHVWP